MINIYDFLRSQGDEYRTLSFKDLLFAHYQCPQRDRYSKTYTHHNSIVYVISGTKAYHGSGKSYPLTEGGCFFVKKGACDQERFYDQDWLIMAFFVPDDYFRQVIQEYRSLLPLKSLPEFPKDLVLTLHMQDILKGFFDSMMPYFLQKPHPPESLIELKCRELLFSLLSDPGNAGLLSYISHVCDSIRPPLEEVMESNYMYNLSLTEFARIAQRSLATFNRDFVKQFKVTPGKWLTQKRLDHAQLLLDTTKKSVNEVADDCGFENPTHFSRVFKERSGMSPRQYREREIKMTV